MSREPFYGNIRMMIPLLFSISDTIIPRKKRNYELNYITYFFKNALL